MNNLTSSLWLDSVSLQEVGLQAQFTAGQWSGKAMDSNASHTAEQAAGAKTGAFRTTKRLLIGADHELKAIASCISEARRMHTMRTIGWGHHEHAGGRNKRGIRVLPSLMAMDYMAEQGKKQAEFKRLVEDFTDKYPQLVAAAKSNLGTAFQPHQYPMVGQLGSMFYMDFELTPLPSGSAFKGLPPEVIAQLSDQLEDRVQGRLDNAMTEVWHRVHAVANHIMERTKDEETMQRTRVDLVETSRESLKLLAKMNLVKDPQLHQTIVAVNTALSGLTMEMLLSNKAEREKLHDTAAHLCATMAVIP